MTNRNARHAAVRLSLTAVAVAGLALGAAGCEKKKKPAPPPPPPPPPVHVDPDPVDINGVMAEISPDARVKFPESKAPADRSLAEAAIRLADAFAKGDTAALRGMLTAEARGPLDSLVSDGLWSEETKKIEQVRVVQVNPQYELDATSGVVVLALQVPGGAYPLAWNATKNGSEWMFKNMPVEDRELSRASDFDSVALRLGSSFGPEPTHAGRSEGSTGEGGEEGSTAEDPERDPMRRGTPAGPITIPGGKPGGGS